jgi:large subunit ribosomal protein L24e
MSSHITILQKRVPADSSQDSTFEFEKRRNVPVRYDRELVATTLKAMERVQEIKAKREKAFWKSR